MRPWALLGTVGRWATAKNPAPLDERFSRSVQTFAELAQREAAYRSRSRWMSITGSVSGDA